MSKKSHRRIIVAQSEIYRVKKSYKIRKTIICQKLGLEYSNLSRSICTNHFLVKAAEERPTCA